LAVRFLALQPSCQAVASKSAVNHIWCATNPFVDSNRNNAYLIDDGANLEEFLFGDERVPLGKVREVLQPVQSGRCFYCGTHIDATAHVDHFVPFSLYPGNLAHNLVLAHAGCNGDKSDLLADVLHLDRWLERNHRYGTDIGEALAERGIVSDLEATRGIARWAYGRAQQHGALLWIRRRETRPFPEGLALPF
jgi:5-methylcytosine-specific restriction endonuclease McrA